MDPAKVEVIDRFAQAVSCHGAALLNLTQEAQGGAKQTALDFLLPWSHNRVAANYFHERLQANNSRQPTPDGSFPGFRIFPSEQHDNQPDKSARFRQRLNNFIASKADLVFQLRGKQQLRRGIDYEEDSNQQVLDQYAKVPPLESFMGIPAEVRRWRILQLLNMGSIVLGEVSSKQPFGILVELKMMEFGKTRDFHGTDLQALCRTCELTDSEERHWEHKDPADKFAVGDFVRGVVFDANPAEGQVFISFKSSRLPPQHLDISLGLIEDGESIKISTPELSEDASYEACLESHMGFNNPRNIETLLDILGIETQAPCSLLRSCQRVVYPEEDYAGPLRKKQSAKWSIESTAKGVEHFKAGDVNTALKYLEHALQINAENLEALVARGALTANEGKYKSAIVDFRHALTISSHHKNALKYLVETLIQQGIQNEKDGHLSDAASCFQEAYELDKDQPAAKEHYEKIRLLLEARRKRRESASGPSGKAAHRDPSSKFSHVRQLIEQEQVKKRKKKKEKKKRKKMKAAEKRRRRTKARRRSRRSSESDESTSTATETSQSESESETEWVQKPTEARGKRVRSTEKEGRRLSRDDTGKLGSSDMHTKTERNHGNYYKTRDGEKRYFDGAGKAVDAARKGTTSGSKNALGDSNNRDYRDPGRATARDVDKSCPKPGIAAMTIGQFVRDIRNADGAGPSRVDDFPGARSKSDRERSGIQRDEAPSSSHKGVDTRRGNIDGGKVEGVSRITLCSYGRERSPEPSARKRRSKSRSNARSRSRSRSHNSTRRKSSRSRSRSKSRSYGRSRKRNRSRRSSPRSCSRSYSRSSSSSPHASKSQRNSRKRPRSGNRKRQRKSRTRSSSSSFSRSRSRSPSKTRTKRKSRASMSSNSSSRSERRTPKQQYSEGHRTRSLRSKSHSKSRSRSSSRKTRWSRRALSKSSSSGISESRSRSRSRRRLSRARSRS